MYKEPIVADSRTLWKVKKVLWWPVSLNAAYDAHRSALRTLLPAARTGSEREGTTGLDQREIGPPVVWKTRGWIQRVVAFLAFSVRRGGAFRLLYC